MGSTTSAYAALWPQTGHFTNTTTHTPVPDEDVSYLNHHAVGDTWPVSLGRSISPPSDRENKTAT